MTNNTVNATCNEPDKVLSPTQPAKEASPWWFETINTYDGLELSAVAEYEDKDDTKFCERVDNPQEAQFWSVYGHRYEGGVEYLEDFDTEQEASDFANGLLKLYPNLQKYGLMWA